MAIQHEKLVKLAILAGHAKLQLRANKRFTGVFVANLDRIYAMLLLECSYLLRLEPLGLVVTVGLQQGGIT